MSYYVLLPKLVIILNLSCLANADNFYGEFQSSEKKSDIMFEYEGRGNGKKEIAHSLAEIKELHSSRGVSVLAMLLLALRPAAWMHQSVILSLRTGSRRAIPQPKVRHAGRHAAPCLNAQVVPVQASLLSLLPPQIAAARQAVAWPTVLEAHPPMLYERLQSLPADRLHASMAALSKDLEGTIASLGGSDYARVAVALLLLGGGGADECHDLVTPLSWPDHTFFAGDPVPGSPAEEQATHAHALVHRKEAWHVGEFGTGWQNSGFWFGSVMGGPSAIQRFARMNALAVKAAAGNAEKQRWAEEYLASSWSPTAVNGLINEALHDNNVEAKGLPSDKKKLDPSLWGFAEELALIELCVLLDECLEKSLAPTQ
mmetsp:Transcript_156301/g.299687  ORF Transcript_156301/g.299687 Transcript_156301/m.299687 type:complete len:371 (+) Transcript_156301:31-1143(+)